MMLDMLLDQWIDLAEGTIDQVPSRPKRLSALRAVFRDRAAFEAAVRSGDPVVYDVHVVEGPAVAGELSYGTTVLYPGRVGDEFYMTHGHLHSWLESAELYLGLAGRGLLLLEDETGKTRAAEMRPGQAVYVPGRTMHRSINTGDSPFVTFAVWPSLAGHNYEVIEQRGFSSLVLARGNGYELVARDTRD